MQNKLQLSGQIVKKGSYYILETPDFDILIVCYSLQHLEKWRGDWVTITGRLRKVKAFHLYAEKIEMMMDPLKRQADQAPAAAPKPTQGAQVSPQKVENQEKSAEIDISAGFADLVRKLKNID